VPGGGFMGVPWRLSPRMFAPALPLTPARISHLWKRSRNFLPPQEPSQPTLPSNLIVHLAPLLHCETPRPALPDFNKLYDTVSMAVHQVMMSSHTLPACT
jgi:hypothetical protein